MTTSSEAQDLIRRMAAGDSAALSLFYDRYAQMVLNLALRVVGSVADAEEVLQEVFWQAWRSAGRYDPSRGSPEAWLATLARTRAIDALRSLRSVRRVSGDSEGWRVEGASAVAPTTSDALEHRQLVESALAALSTPQREAVELAYYEGLSQSEIAARTGTPLGTVKTRIRSGLARLREALAAGGRLDR
jgi:RNA polymerase sigma-70 factor (ECF subfamily)